MNTEILFTEQMKLSESAAIGGKTTYFTLMQRAGKAVAEAIRERYEKQSVLVICGPGNNGGDGFIVAAELSKKKWDVAVSCVYNLEDLDGDLSRAAKEWGGEIIPIDKLKLPKSGLIVDALFGTGLEREITGYSREILFGLQHTSCPVIAVDVPSGLYSDTGECQPCTPQAELTVTFFRKKIGHVLMPGRFACGEIVVADIGIPDDVLTPFGKNILRENSPELGWKEDAISKAEWTNKYHHGHVVVLGGRVMTGAASLAALAALRVGAGLVTIASHPETLETYRLASPSLMVEPMSEMARFKEHFVKDTRRNVVLIGPGAGQDHPAALKKAVFDATATGEERLCVLDADALSVFEDDVRTFHKALGPRCILTPHEGEFERIFPGLHGSKIERARIAAEKSKSIIVLKGADTVIASPDGRVVINTTGSGWLSTAGTGDVLAGMIAGLAARRVLPPFEATCAAVWMHGKLSELIGPALISEDMCRQMTLVFDHLVQTEE